MGSKKTHRKPINNIDYHLITQQSMKLLKIIIYYMDE
jgi:hypothetical protein